MSEINSVEEILEKVAVKDSSVVGKKKVLATSFIELEKKVAKNEFTYEEIHKSVKAMLKKDDKLNTTLRANKPINKLYTEAINLFIFSDSKYSDYPNTK